ncbi:hypothetical protein BBO99_00000849 [Phytophthora kernoviae]|uniref:U1-type domain-containing protein n=1 Tax=Phytophthora kernoviae TaxID=325452 RepID=A0A421FGD8_9STRA|nr:hypothetical protein BBI17_000971 [Phytophthora kernoviae]RLN85003.1 hypothetical protein BBO99_00000849 [Phytophthora kernoviae]
MKPKDKVAMQFKRPGSGQGAHIKKQKQQRRKTNRSVEIVRPWTVPQFEELSKEDRDIVLDRLQKEVATVSATRNQAVLGVNQVARCVARGELRVVVFANNPESLTFGHLPLLCRLHRVPICVLHLSSKTFGKMFGLKSMVAVGIRVSVKSDAEQNAVEKAPASSEAEKASEDKTASAKTKKPVVLSDAEEKKVESIRNFLISKASKPMTTLRKVLVVIGTTGAGKTKLSVDLAKAVGGEIVNSDAMQMYRGLDVATAKITEQEKQGVPHHLFDVVDPSSRCDVLEFKRLALQAIDDILARGKVPVVVGGTMYYTQSILWKSQLLDDVPVRASEEQQEKHTPEDLYARLQSVDPVMAARLHVNNVRKVQRSLQVFEQTGVPHSELLAQQEREQRNVEKYFDACAFWVHANKPVLSERLAKRVNTMLSSGLVDEIRGLRAHVKENPPRLNPGSEEEEEAPNSVGILQAIGYKEFQPYFDALETDDGPAEGSKELEAVFDSCVEQLNVATRQYARRQLSWIRNKLVTKNIPVYQVDSSDVAQWDTIVAQPTIEIAQKFLKDEEITTHQSMQQQNPETSRAATLEDKFQQNTCNICGDRQFTGKKQWSEHLRSKGHKYHLKRIQIEMERAERGEPPIPNKRRRQEGKQSENVREVQSAVSVVES